MSTSVAAESQALHESPLRVRELDIGAAIDDAVLLLRRHFGLFATLVLIAYVPCTYPMLYFAALVSARMMEGMMSGNFLMIQEASEMNSIWQTLLSLGHTFVVQPATIGVVTYATARTYTGHTPTIRETIVWLLRNSVSLLFAWFLFTVSVSIGTLLCLVPGVLLMLYFSLVVPVIAVEGAGPIAAMSRSIDLAKRNLLPLLGLILVLGVVGVFLNGLNSIIPEPHTSAIVGAFATGMVLALKSAAMTVYYFSCRCQHEHYDLRLLAEGVVAGREEPATAAFSFDDAADRASE